MTVGQPNRGSHTLLILLVLIWGASWPVTKIGVTAVTPIWFACLRYVVATVCLVVVVGLRGELALPSRSDLKLVTVSGILQMASYSALTAVALTRLPPGARRSSPIRRRCGSCRSQPGGCASKCLGMGTSVSAQA